MLTGKFRIKSGRDFELIKKHGKITQGDGFAVLTLQKPEQEYSRVGFIVSKKVSNLATQRNRIKRAISEAVRYNLGRIVGGYDIVFLATGDLVKRSTSEIMHSVEAFIDNSDLLKKNGTS